MEEPQDAVVAFPAEAEKRPYLNRELSWLEFNARVLAIAEDLDRPVLERAKFLAIFSRNLDEFFQVRVGGLREQLVAGVGSTAPDAMTPAEQLSAIRERVQEQIHRQSTIFAKEVEPDLKAAGIRICDWGELDEADRKHLGSEFEQHMFPVLTPLAVDPAHPFPYISNLSLNLAVVVHDPVHDVQRIARMKIPPLLPRLVPLPDGERFVPLEQVIGSHLASLFRGMEIVDHHPFRVTRNADYDLDDDEGEDLVAAVERVLLQRRRSPLAVRLEIKGEMPGWVRERLIRELELEPTDVYVVEGLQDLSALMGLYGLSRPDLKDEPWIPTTQPRLAPTGGVTLDLFASLREADILVHHPYDSFESSVVAFVNQAARDPAVQAIKQTLYRTSDAESPIVLALIRAANAGKQVVALVELKARFDEASNITWARVLEEAGVHVVYGVVGLKTHAKTTLIVRLEGTTIRRYAHIGTGNYNPDTAHQYEDVGLLTADPELGADVGELFNYLTGYSRQRTYRRLLVAPVSLRARLVELIEREANPDGRIIIKVNNLVDRLVIDALDRAAQAGARVDLIVRSISCLRPGVNGLSERVRVRSIVGRYLEHSRIFRFGTGEEADFYIGSADLMQRNLDRRVEAMVPVTDPTLRARLDEILELNLSDDVLAWELGPDGTWSKVARVAGLDTQQQLQQRAEARMSGPSDTDG
jgi:polyphosphate kinase